MRLGNCALCCYIETHVIPFDKKSIKTPGRILLIKKNFTEKNKNGEAPLLVKIVIILLQWPVFLGQQKNPRLFS